MYINLSYKTIQWVLAALVFMIPLHLTVGSKLRLSSQKAYTVRKVKGNVATMERHNGREGDETCCVSLVSEESADIIDKRVRVVLFISG
jgi:hypothetical protein